MTYYDLIRSSLRLIGQLRPGYGPNGSEITDALFVMNSMLDSWSLEHLNIYTVGRTSYPLSGKASYTFGPSGDFPDRPLRIESAAWILSGSSDYEYPVPVITDQRWQLGGGPSPSGAQGVYYDNGFPLATVYLRPAPAVQTATQLVLYTWTPLTGVDEETQDVVFPPGYADAIRYNLAERCALEWGKVAQDGVHALAISSKAAIKSFNMQPIEMDATDGGALGCGG